MKIDILDIHYFIVIPNLVYYIFFRSSRPEAFCKKVVLRNLVVASLPCLFHSLSFKERFEQRSETYSETTKHQSNKVELFAKIVGKLQQTKEASGKLS